MSNIVDLDILFEKPKKKVKLKSKDGQEFILELKVNTELALKSSQLFKDDKSEYEQSACLLSYIIEYQTEKKYDEEWILENIGWEKILYIGRKLSEEIINSMDIINSKNDNNDSGKTTKKK